MLGTNNKYTHLYSSEMGAIIKQWGATKINGHQPSFASWMLVRTCLGLDWTNKAPTTMVRTGLSGVNL